MNPKLAVVTVWAEDVPEVAHFYRNVIGLEPMHAHGGVPHFNLGGVILVVIQGKPSPAKEAHPEHFPIMAFSVENLDQEIEMLASHGIDRLGDMVEREKSRWIMFHDPAGNLLEYVQYV
jgi:catechol-2,3-dioxygenase